MKKTALGFIALAMSLMATTVNAFNGAGDIRSINRCDENGKVLSPMADGDYAIAGDKVYFRVRLENVHSGELATLGLQNKWQLKNISGDESAKPTIGVYVSGLFREATIVKVQTPSDVDVVNGATSNDKYLVCYTDLVCEYTVQPGDFAFPMTLANSSKQEVSAAGGEKYWLNPEFELRAKSWTSGTIGDENSPYEWVTGTLAFGDNREISSSEAGFWQKDFALDQANIRVKTLDFLQTDIQLDEGDAKIVDVVFHGGTNSVGGAVYLKVKDGINFQLVKTGAANVSVKSMKGPDGVEADYQCLKVEIPSGVSSFQVKVLGTLNGAEGVLYLSSTEAFTEGKSGVHTPNYITANLLCGSAKRRVAVEINPADLTLTNGTAKATVTPSSDYATALRRLTVKLSTAYTSDVKVKVDATMVSSASASVEPIGKYIALSSLAEDGYLGKEDTVTFTVAEMNRGVLSKDIYVYVLGGDDETSGTGKGILFTPVVEGTASAATYYNETALTSVLMIEKSKPVVLNYADFDDYANGIPGGVEYIIPIKIQDSYNDIGSAYEVTWKRSTTDSRWMVAEFVDGVNKPDSDGYLYIKVKYNGGAIYSSKFKVTNASGGAVEFNINNIKVNDANQAFAVVEGAEDEVEFDEIDEEGYETVLNISFKLNNPHTDTIYAFLVPLDEASSNKVECKAFTTGIAIRGGETESVQSVPMTILDGSDDTLPLSFAIELRHGKTLSSDLFEGVYECKDLDLFINNVAPVVNAVEMSGSLPVYKSGDTFTGKASIGLQKVFTLDVIDSMEDWSGNAKAVWTFADPNGFAGTPKTYEGPLCDICVTNQFTVAGTYTCTVKVQDKDMLSGRKYSEVFEFKVVVDPRPSIQIEFPNSNTFNEDEADKGTSFFNVKLSTPATKQVVVKLDCKQVGLDGVLNIATDEVIFNPGEVTKQVIIDELDGTVNSLSYKGGFELNAEVVTTDVNEDGQALKDVYLPAVVKMYVANVSPVIELPLDPGTTNDMPINVNFMLKWKIADIDADLADGLVVTWQTSEQVNQEFTSAEGVFTNKFTSTGYQWVQIYVTDKDSGQSEVRRINYWIAPSKRVRVYPYGPMENGGSDLVTGMTQYFLALGRGEGRVWADSGSCEISDFRHDYSYGSVAKSAEVFAWGYKSGQVDDGSLDASGKNRDMPINNFGDYVESNDGSANYYTYASIYDSFFYGWVVGVRDDKGAYQTKTVLISPTRPNSRNNFGQYTVTLPMEQQGDNEKTNPDFPDSEVAAFFSRELYSEDNIGDMNGDGIPDYYAVLYWSLQSGESKTIAEAMTGAKISDGGEEADKGIAASDLTDVSKWNDTDLDFLPKAFNSPNPLKPQTLDWSAGEPFTALLEIRGFGVGLNEPGISEYVLTAAETNALFAACAAAGEPAADYVSATNWATRNAWTPEAINPETGARLNPLHPDTDGDGFDDGWEYYFWYYAKNGAVVDGVWSRLEGRRFAITSNSLTSVTISADEIAVAFNPHVARDVNGQFAMDFDNDGLTDLEEFVLGTNPCDWDSDGDGISDLWEVMMGTNPCSADKDDSNPDCDFMARLDYAEDTFTLYTMSNGDIYALPSATLSSEAVEASTASQTVFKIEILSDTYWTAAKPAVYELDGKIALSSYVVAYRNVACDGVDYLGKQEMLKPGTVVASIAEEAVEVPFASTVGFNWMNPETKDKEVTKKALKVFNYGGDGVTYVPCTSNLVSYVDIPEGAELVDVRKEATITLIHDQVCNHEGFDPRVAWNIDANGLLDQRWQKQDSDEEGTFGLAGVPTNTVAYSTLDEFLLLQYRLMTGKIEAINNDNLLQLFKGNTTYPNLPVDFIRQKLSYSYKPFASTNSSIMAYWDSLLRNNETDSYGNSANVHGADTDRDGVPDGWELYVGYNPNDKVDGGSHIDTDKLSLVQEYAGVDSCNAYTNRYEGNILVYPEVYTITMNHPGKTDKWWNKFFPTNPNNSDTDGDGLNDSQERDSWSGTLPVGYNEYPAKFTFIYGKEGEVESHEKYYGRNAKSTCFRGGGLNPCSVDTDCDLLPDAWEYEFAGINWAAENHSLIAPATLSVADEKALTVGIAYHTKTNGDDHIRGGMDGTIPFNTPDNDANYDYDNDGLSNFQEYLVQTLRHLRYDDSLTPLMGVDPVSKQFVRFIQFSAWDGNAFHKKCNENGFTGLGAWQFRKLGYFALPPRKWDPIALNTTGLRACSNYKHSEGAGYRVLLRPSMDIPLIGEVQATGYACTDPRRIDTDNDGMDDYYELFHGLNPLLGTASDPMSLTSRGTRNYEVYDVIAKVYAGKIRYSDGSPFSAWKNNWVLDENRASNGQPNFHAIMHPWMIGTMECDADGDGLRNDEESLKVNVAAPQNTHTDPTPLWMTDSTSVRFASFTSQYYNADPYIKEVPEYMEGETKPDIFKYSSWTDFYSDSRTFTFYSPDDVSSATVLREGTGGMSTDWMFSFEENEGYDTDRDFNRDASELVKGVNLASDPQNYMDPNRRQALYLPGDKSAAVSYESEARREVGTEADMLKQFTAECWICPEGVQTNAVVFERVAVYGPSTLSNNLNYVRANIRIGFDGGKLYGEYEGSTIDSGVNRVTYQQDVQPDVWTHVALTYDGSSLLLYLNGEVLPVASSSNVNLLPANGIQGILQYPDSSVSQYNGYRALPVANVIGARALTPNAVRVNSDTKWLDFSEYFKGWIDEVRIWDGARTPSEIHSEYLKRYTLDDVKRNREDVYDRWSVGANRAGSNGLTLPSEILFHYNFVSLPGGIDESNVITSPSGFQKAVLDNVRNPNTSDLDIALDIGWWSKLPVKSSVYFNYSYVPWIPNTVAHMPLFDGSTVDSRYWSETVAGVADNVEGYSYANTANPYVGYMRRYDKLNRNIKLSLMQTSGVYSNATAIAELVKKYKFQLRSDYVGSTDLIPLGGAFAKRGANFWDNEGAMDAWTLTSKNYEEPDADADGIPDWANNLGYNTAEAYLRALAEGLLPSGTKDPAFAGIADAGKDGLADWWQRIYDLKGSPQDDTDKDGLADFAEYLISESPLFKAYGLPKVSPVLSKTNGKDFDYFLRAGKVYLGELFTDHDFMEDEWENLFANSDVSAAKYDSAADPDADGWSNYAECRAGTLPNRTANITIDAEQLPEYPEPIISVKAFYKKAMHLDVPIVVKSYSSRSYGEEDATWVIPPSAGTKSDVRYLGIYPDKKMKYYLGPGVLVPGTIVVETRDPSEISDGEQMSALKSDWRTSIFESPIEGDNDKANLVMADYGVIVGSVVYRTGEVEIDYTKIPRYRSESQAGKTSFDYLEYKWSATKSDLKRSYYKIEWDCKRIKEEAKWEFTLSRADKGRVMEGRNTFVLFADVDGNGEYSTSEPMGIVRDVDVGWSSAEFTVELTDASPICERTSFTEVSSNKNTMVYVYRYSVDDLLVPPSTLDYGPVVTKELGARTYIHEYDLLKTADYDLDWSGFAESVLDDVTVGAAKLPVNKVVYRAYFKEVDIVDETVNSNGTPYVEIVREFGKTRAKAIPLAPFKSSAIFYGNRPTFKWTIDGERSDSFTAFKIRVKSGNAVVWNSGLQMLPPRNASGEYEWTAPLYVGDRIADGTKFGGRDNYTWAVSVYNSKYQSDDWSDKTYPDTWFRMNVYDDDEVNNAGVYSFSACVKYFGPGFIGTNVAGIVRAEAFAMPDFSGLPLARTAVNDLASVTNGAYEANVKFTGLEAGTYYLRAYIDSDGDGTCSPWESWGYPCGRGDVVAGAIFAPTAINVGLGHSPLEVAYIEDTDIDQDCLPDIYEYNEADKDNKAAVKGEGFLTLKGPSTNVGDGYIGVNPELAANIVRNSGNTMAYMFSAGATAVPSDLVALTLGLETAENTVEESTLGITEFSLADASVKITIGAKANEPDLGEWYVKDSSVKTTIVIKHTDTLGGTWNVVKEEAITLQITDGAVSETFSIPLDGLDTSKGFFKVELK